MDHVRNQTVSVSVLRRRGLPSKRPEGTFSKDRNVLCLILLMITQVNMTGKIHQTEHLKSELFFCMQTSSLTKEKKKIPDPVIGFYVTLTSLA